MAGSRTLKLSILGDVDNLNKSLKTATGNVDTFGDKIGKAGAKIGKAFAAAAAAAGAAAIAIGIESVKAAIADEKAQTQLALALENATGATQAQIKATEDSILKMSLATGVADDELRPALGRLVRSTGDTEKAQQLLAQALDISTATGKPLETVANALGKAYDGNTTSLGKLGIGLSAAELKTMSFTDVQGKLTDLFGGAAARNADTYAGQIARVQVAFDEAKETVGVALLPILDKLLQFINQNALPAITAFSDAFSLTKGDGFGKVINDVAKVIKDIATPIFEAMRAQFDKVKTVISENKENLESFFEVVKFVAPIIGKVLGAAVRVVGDIAEVVLSIIGKVLGAIKPLINFAIDGINLVIKGYNAIQFGKDVPAIPKIGATPATSGGSGFSGTMPGGQSFTTTGGKSTSSSSGGVATASKVAASTSAAASKIVSSNTSSTKSGGNASAGTTINLNVSGALDKEGTARTIVETLNNSFYRGTGGASAFVTA
jgi:phage-related protein